MFQSQVYTQKLSELRQFLNKLTLKIIESEEKNTDKRFLNSNGLMSAYTIVYELSNSKPSLQEKMLEEFKSCLVTFIESYVHLSLVNTPKRFSLECSKEVIEWFNSFWFKFMKFLLEISKKVFVYLDRHYLPGLESNSLFKVGIKVFEKNLCHERNIEFFQDCYFKELREIREKKIIQSSELLRMAEAFAIINPELITKLTERYIRESSQYYLTVFIKSNQLSYSQYVNKIYNFYLFEVALIEKSICMNVLEQLMLFGEFRRHLVENYTSIFLDHGLKPMFKTQNIDTMKVLYQLYKRFEELEKIRQAYYDFLIEEGDQLIQKYLVVDQSKEEHKIQRKLSEEQISFIEVLHEFYKSHLHLLTQGFRKDNELLVTLNNAIEKIIAKNDKFASILFEYCSSCRSIGTFVHNKEKITLLFEKISSKDEFIALYEHELFKKIKTNQIIINEEENFVNYLNEMYFFFLSRCGNELTLRLLKKIKDFKEMSEINQEITTLTNYYSDTKINLTVLSLQLWEKMFVDQVSLNLTLPEIMMSKWSKIENEFIEKEKKRKLIPLPFESSLVLYVHFNTHKISMKCHLIQAAVLTYIASRSYTSEEELIMNLRLEKNILQSTIETLETVPSLLLKTSLGDYIVNWNWIPSQEFKQSQMIDFIVKSPETTKLITKNVKQDREILVEAAIVKFIKKAKNSTFEEIAISVTNSIRLFKPQPSLIKASVEKLIKKGFIEEGENGLLEYVE